MRHREKPAPFCPRDCPCGPCFLLLAPAGGFKEEFCVEGIFGFFLFSLLSEGKMDWGLLLHCAALTFTLARALRSGECHGGRRISAWAAAGPGSGAAGTGGGRWGPAGWGELSAGGGMRLSPRLRIALPDIAFRLYFLLFRVIV